MTDEQTDSLPDPYLLEDPPGSVGRLFLARAFAHYLALHFGYSGEEISEALRGGGEAGVAENVRMSVRLIGDAFARQIVRTWTRPIGGGEPAQLRSGVWEIDRYERRFAASAMDPRNPFDERATNTSWLFVDADDWNALVEASLGEDAPSRRRRSFRLGQGAPVEIAPTVEEAGPGEIAVEGAGGRLLRLPEVRRLTGMSRSTIYRRIGDGRFPACVPMSGSIAAWREGEVLGWLADPD